MTLIHTQRYNHACTLAFEVVSGDPEGEDITIDMLKAALARRMRDLDTSQPGGAEWVEAVLPPYDTYKMESDARSWSELTPAELRHEAAHLAEQTHDEVLRWLVALPTIDQGAAEVIIHRIETHHAGVGHVR